MVISVIRKFGYLVFFICSSTLLAQQASNFTVQFSSQQVKVFVSRPASLSAILIELCHQSNSQCDGTDLTEAVQVAPTALQGTWDEVLAKLMEGTSLNFVTVAGTAGAPGTLLIQSRPTGAVQASTYSANETSSEPVDSAPQAQAAQLPSAPAEDSSSGSDATSSEAQLGGSGLGTESFGTYAGTNGSPLTSEVQAENSQSHQGPSYLPFPDSSGRLIPASSEPQQYLPFPDGRGNLIPVPQTTGSPFPLGKTNPE